MGFLSIFGLKKKPSATQMRTMLPALHSFVDVAVKNGPKGSVCFENAGAKTFITSSLPGMAPGQSANFLYSNPTGKYRFTASITNVDAKQATFAIPGRIETVQKFGGSHRKTVRIDTTVSITWRYAPTGKIESTWEKGVLSDLSRSGASLACDREPKIGAALELKIPIKPGGGDVLVKGDARRVDRIGTTKKFSAGLRFVSVSPESDQAIMEFINRRQTDLRNRGLG